MKQKLTKFYFSVDWLKCFSILNEFLINNFSNLHDALNALIWLLPTPIKVFLWRKFFLILKLFFDFFERIVLMRSRNSFGGLYESLIYASLKQLFEVLNWLLITDNIKRIYRIWRFLRLLRFFLGL